MKNRRRDPKKIYPCIHCGSKNTIRWGTYKSTIRVRCKDCNGTFCPESREEKIKRLHEQTSHLSGGEIKLLGKMEKIDRHIRALEEIRETSDMPDLYVEWVDSLIKMFKSRLQIFLDNIT